LLILATGAVAEEAVQASELLHSDGESPAVAILAHLGLAADWTLVKLLSRFLAVITVEEGVTVGGLGDLVARAIAEYGLKCRLIARGVDVPFAGVSGNREYMLRRVRLTGQQIAETARRLLAHRQAA
jgi:transketolase